MVVGDVKSAHESVADDAYLTIRPNVSEAWTIHNIFAAGQCELYKTDGTNDVLIGTFIYGRYLTHHFHCTRDYYYRVKNISGTTIYIGYDGVEADSTKVISSMSSISNGNYLTIQPSVGVEWVIHNILANGNIELYKTDGANQILIASDFESLLMLRLHPNSTYYYEVKNISGATMYIGYDGIITS